MPNSMGLCILPYINRKCSTSCRKKKKLMVPVRLISKLHCVSFPVSLLENSALVSFLLNFVSTNFSV